MERTRLELHGHCPACRAQVDFPEYRRERTEDGGRSYGYCPNCGAGLRPARMLHWVHVLWPLMFLAQLFFLDLDPWPAVAKTAWMVLWVTLVIAAFVLPRYRLAAYPPRERLEMCPLAEPVSATMWAGIVVTSIVVGVLMFMAFGAGR